MEEEPLGPKPRKSAALWKKLRYSYRSIPDKKQYVEFFTALLSVPVLLTVILLNINNLRTKPQTTTPSPTPTEKEKIIYVSPQTVTSSSPKNSNVAPTNAQCKKDLPPVTIQYPNEGDTIEDNPLKVSITYPKDSDFCSIVWSYRINNGTWSDYDDNSIALFDLPSGKVSLDLRVKSIVTGEGETLRRTFQYINPSITPDKTSSGSATQQ